MTRIFTNKTEGQHRYELACGGNGHQAEREVELELAALAVKPVEVPYVAVRTTEVMRSS